MRFRVFGFIFLVMGIFSLNLLSVAAQATIVVNSSADNTTVGDGECTLREAITNANNNTDSTGGDCAAGIGTDTIEFNIAGAGPHTILLGSLLPTISEAIFLDALTQSGADCKSSLMIIITEVPGTVGDALNLTVGSSGSRVRGLVINSFTGIAININDSSNHRIQCNFIGTNATGTATAGNANGVFLIGTASGNIIGTDSDGTNDANEGNLISGNTIGVTMSNSTNITNNIVAGNLIGTDITGTLDFGNRDGVNMRFGPQNNIVGTNGDGKRDAIEGNLLSGNNRAGVVIVASNNNRVAGNLMGSDINGTAAVPNGNAVLILNNSTGTIVGTNSDGTSDALEGNLVSGNSGSGVHIDDSDETIVAGNLIGTDISGTLALGNGFSGVQLTSGSLRVQIGTDGDRVSDALEGNLISSSANFGINFCSACSDGVVAGNKIGTDINGTAALANGADGIFLPSANNRIGTNEDGASDALEANLISGNMEDGIEINGSLARGNTIAGNIIGLNDNSSAALGNAGNGIHILQDANTNTLGATSLARGNRIGGNGAAGILIEGGNSPDNIISFNYIGTNPAAANLANGTNGIELSPTVAGLTVVSHNWIFYHPTTGILLSNAADLGAAGTSENNCLYQNTVGVDNTTGISLFFENNWWGHRTGPSGVGTGQGDSVSADVDYQSFLQTAPNGCPPVINPPTSVSGGIAVFDPAISKLGFLLAGQTGIVGEELEWVVTVSNTSAVVGTNVTISDTLIPALQIDSVDAPGATVSIVGQTVTVVYPSLAVGQSVQFSIFTTVLQGRTISNTACVNAANQGAEECAIGLAVSQLPSTGEAPLWRYGLLLIGVLILGMVALIWKSRKA